MQIMWPPGRVALLENRTLAVFDFFFMKYGSLKNVMKIILKKEVINKQKFKKIDKERKS